MIDTPEEIKQPFDTWALLELFGHARICGRVTDAEIGGGSFIRVDVPDANGETLFTRYYGPKAIYSISPVSRQTAIGVAQKIDAKPVRPFDLIADIQASKVGSLTSVEEDAGVPWQ